MTEERAKKVLQEQIEKYGQEYDAEGIEALEMAIKALEQTRWIPVSERLPEEDGAYLVTNKWKGSYSGDVYIETNMAVYRKQRKEWDCVDVIAWMPLPESYKETAMESEKCKRCIYTYGTLGCCNQVHNEWIYDCDFGQEQYEKRRFLNGYLRKWLSSFNTNSATVCFTAVQELKKRLEGEK